MQHPRGLVPVRQQTGYLHGIKKICAPLAALERLQQRKQERNPLVTKKKYIRYKISEINSEG